MRSVWAVRRKHSSLLQLSRVCPEPVWVNPGLRHQEIEPKSIRFSRPQGSRTRRLPPTPRRCCRSFSRPSWPSPSSWRWGSTDRYVVHSRVAAAKSFRILAQERGQAEMIGRVRAACMVCVCVCVCVSCLVLSCLVLSCMCVCGGGGGGVRWVCVWCGVVQHLPFIFPEVRRPVGCVTLYRHHRHRRHCDCDCDCDCDCHHHHHHCRDHHRRQCI